VPQRPTVRFSSVKLPEVVLSGMDGRGGGGGGGGGVRKQGFFKKSLKNGPRALWQRKHSPDKRLVPVRASALDAHDAHPELSNKSAAAFA
jgi:hypothetical protein